MKTIVNTIAAVLMAAEITVVVAGCERPLSRPEGPCDIYAEAGTPCASAHSTTRALYKGYDGPLYQIMRQSDGKTRDIGVVKATAKDAGGYADAAAQDRFLRGTYGWITIIYDQGPAGNHLTQAPRGRFGGPAMGGFNNLPIADMAPVSVMGHKVYGVYIIPGMGLRCNDTRGIAVDDQSEGQYWVVAGNHFNDGCCFDYGNAEIDSDDDGDGTMESTYFGSSIGWHRGVAPGPWIMSDQENHLVGCDEDRPENGCTNLPSLHWRFVTSMVDGEPHRWRLMGGDAQNGPLAVYWDGGRIRNERNSYDPMRKQGGIVLGNGGDNSSTSQGTFYEGAITFAGTFPSEETQQRVQENIVSARYLAPCLSVGPLEKIHAPAGLQTFCPGRVSEVAVKYINTTPAIVDGLTVSLKVPSGWKVDNKRQKVDCPLEPGQSIVLLFEVTPGRIECQDDIVACAKWDCGEWTAVQKVRNVPSVKINEFCIDGGEVEDNSYVELFNDGERDVDISGWSMTMRCIHMPITSEIIIPDHTVIPPGGHYLMGLSPSGLVVPAAKGDTVLYVRNVKGVSVGDEITVGSGANAEKRKVAGVSLRTKMDLPSAIWQPLPDGPVIEVPEGADNIPVFNVKGIEEGSRIAVGYGADYPVSGMIREKYEVVTATRVGMPGNQAYLAFDAKPGDTNIKVTSIAGISVGDEIRLDIDSEGHGIETVRVKSIGTPSEQRSFYGPMSLEQAGSGLDLESPIKYAHSANLPFAVKGSGISVNPPLKHAHYSNEPVLSLACYIVLEEPLALNHAADDVVMTRDRATGFQGEADLYYGGPAFPVSGGMKARNGKSIHRGGGGAATAGSIVLRTAGRVVCDALNYGLVADPWAAEGFQGTSGKGERGNYVRLYPGGMPMGYTLNYPGVSYSRMPDGTDTDDNSSDFVISQPTPGAPNIMSIK